jgi:hypothetical protein
MVYPCLPRVETPQFLSCGAWGAKLFPLFLTQPFEDTPFAAVMPSCERLHRITHPYPNFLFHGREGTPSFPPVLRANIRKIVRRPLYHAPNVVA